MSLENLHRADYSVSETKENISSPSTETALDEK